MRIPEPFSKWSKSWREATRAQMKWTGILYLVLAAMLVLVLTRKAGFWEDVPVVGTYDLNQNFMNTALSCTLLVAGGTLPLLVGNYVRRTFLLLAGIVVLLNVLVELVSIPGLNTADWRDTLAGMVGVVLALLLTLRAERDLLEK